MVEQRLLAADPSWSEHPADEWADAVITSMKLGGIDHFYFVSGSELSYYQEAVARANARGWPTPKPYTVTHEGAAINAALGTSMVTGGPSATAAHVDVGHVDYGPCFPPPRPGRRACSSTGRVMSVATTRRDISDMAKAVNPAPLPRSTTQG